MSAYMFISCALVDMRVYVMNERIIVGFGEKSGRGNRT